MACKATDTASATTLTCPCIRLCPACRGKQNIKLNQLPASDEILKWKLSWYSASYVMLSVPDDHFYLQCFLKCTCVYVHMYVCICVCVCVRVCLSDCERSLPYMLVCLYV